MARPGRRKRFDHWILAGALEWCRWILEIRLTRPAIQVDIAPSKDFRKPYPVTSCTIYLVTVPQAMRSPEFPDGSVFMSSALA